MIFAGMGALRDKLAVALIRLCRTLAGGLNGEGCFPPLTVPNLSVAENAMFT